MYILKNHKTITSNGADKVPVVILWDCEDFLKQASKNSEDKEVYLEVPNSLSALVSTSSSHLKKCGDLSYNTLEYFLTRGLICKVLLIT